MTINCNRCSREIPLGKEFHRSIDGKRLCNHCATEFHSEHDESLIVQKLILKTLDAILVELQHLRK